MHPEVKKRSSYSLAINERMRNDGVAKVKFDRYEKFVPIPYDTTKISLTFHPEGGSLIPGLSNRLAYKALDKKGLSVDFSGIIVDDHGNFVDSIRSSHLGMGVVDFTPDPARTYTAIVGGEHFMLPMTEPSGLSISIADVDDDSIMMKARGILRPGISVLAHNGGLVTYAKEVKDKEMKINKDELGSGIIQLCLVDAVGNILSSRLIFNHKDYIYDSSLDTLPKGDYAIRSFSGVKPKSSSSIVSGLLLQSELKGYVEDPDYYFKNRDRLKDANLDLLLMTQGWERYDLPSVLKGDFIIPEISLELGGEISGTVKSRWRSTPLSNALVMLIAPKTGYAAQELTDAHGRFSFKGFDWPEDTSFIIQVFGENGDKEHNFNIDDESFPPGELLTERSADTTIDDAADELMLTTGTILLDEIEVTAPLTVEESQREMLSALGVRTYTLDDLEEMHATTYEDVIRKIPGVRIVDGNVVYMQPKGAYNTGSGGSLVELWIDGFKWETSNAYSSGTMEMSGTPQPVGDPMRLTHTYVEHLNNSLTEFASAYPFDVIKSVYYYKPSTAMMISRSAAHNGGALVFTTKEGKDIKDKNSDLFIREFKPLGYQNIPESFKPHYVYDPVSDGEILNEAWIPVYDGGDTISGLENLNVIIEGIANGYMPVMIKVDNHAAK